MISRSSFSTLLDSSRLTLFVGYSPNMTPICAIVSSVRASKLPVVGCHIIERVNVFNHLLSPALTFGNAELHLSASPGGGQQ